MATGQLDGLDVVIAAMEYAFIGGSMGVVAGEKLTRAVEMALERRHPVLIVSCSGGARMMEGALSLMQMAKVSAALARLDRARLPYISILTDPTTGGVTASFAMLGDLNIAEPKALIGFAGPRVIEQTIKQKLPDGFQRSEFLVEHGMLDLVVDRRDMKAVVARALRFMGSDPRRHRMMRPPPASPGCPSRPRRGSGMSRTLSTGSSASRSSGSSSASITSARSSRRWDIPNGINRTVHVAGTNGKGSVTAIVETALRSAGFTTGRYTSPHLLHLTERFAVNGSPVTDAALLDALTTVRSAVEWLRKQGTLDVHPTFFEVTTAIGFELFSRYSVDIAVCEVGLGGRLDATNVLSPMATAITSIAFDHEQYLGNTLGAIAAEKAGIIKPHTPVVVGNMAAEAAAAIERVARDQRAPLIWAAHGVQTGAVATAPDGSQSFTLRTPRRDYGAVRLALAGRHQIDNAVVAVRLLEELEAQGVDTGRDHIIEALGSVQWPGRLERIRLPGGREALLDAAHNAAGAEALAAYLATLGEPRPLVFAAMHDKDAASMLRAIGPRASRIVITRASNPRATEPSELAALAQRLLPAVVVEVAASPADALERAWSASPRIVVAGSIFLLADVMKELGRS